MRPGSGRILAGLLATLLAAFSAAWAAEVLPGFDPAEWSAEHTHDGGFCGRLVQPKLPCLHQVTSLATAVAPPTALPAGIPRTAPAPVAEAIPDSLPNPRRASRAPPEHSPGRLP
ncbi:MAG: hypothetical protein Kow00109_13870 [Acidobacteriota bacterium]